MAFSTSKRWLLELLLLVGLLAQDQPAHGAPITTWLCYYSANFGFSEYGRFDLVVLDGVKHPPLVRKGPGKPLLLGYVSVGEERPGGPAWNLVKDQEFVVAKNENWGSVIIDLRSEKWQSILLDIVIPSVLVQGFDGIFLDTVDSALALSQGDGQAKYANMQTHVLAFLGKVRERFPKIHIALNRGLELMPAAASLVDFLLIEDLSFEYDFAKNEYRAVTPEVRQQLLDAAGRGQAANPKLIVLTLDYAKPDQTDKVSEAISFSRSKGFVPYVSTVSLDQVFYHTLAR